MDIQPTSSPGVNTPPVVPGHNPAAELDSDAFLRLLVKQLETQDPLNPIESEQFTSQLTQFNSLDQLVNINKTLETVAAGQTTLSNLQATAFIGREVTADGSQLHLDDTGESSIFYQLQADATRVVVHVTDSTGSLVRTLELGAQGAGEHSLVWDGKDNSGNPTAPGVYDFEVNAFDVAGEIVSAQTRIQGVVTGVSLRGGNPVVHIGDLELSTSAVTSIRETSDS